MSKIQKAIFYFPDGEGTKIETPIIRDSLTFSEVLHNKLKSSTSQCGFQVPFSIELSDKLKTTINFERVKVELKDGNDDNIATYALEKTVAFTKTQKNQPIQLNCVDFSFRLDESLPRTVVMISKTVTEVIMNLCKEIEFTDFGSINIQNRLPYFVAKEGDKVKDILSELCYEYLNVYYFDPNGRLCTREIFNDIPSNLAAIEQKLDGTNLREKIQITAKEHEADYVSASYNKVEFFSNTLLFSDTQNGTEQDKCKIEIEPYYWMFASSEEMESLNANTPKDNLLKYDSTLGEVLYVSGIRGDLSFDNGIKYNLSRLDAEGNDLIDQCRLSAFNNSSVKRYCRKLDIYGDAFIATSLDTVVSSTGTKQKEIELKYITDKSTAEKFCKGVADYYRWANFDITAKSYEDFEVGSYVRITDYGIGTYYGRIVKKTRTLKNDCLEYAIETIADYEPCEIEKSKSERNSSANAASGSKGATGEVGASGIFVFMEQSSAAFAVDQNEKAEEYTLIVPIHCLCNGMEMPFKVGAIVNPYGMEITDYEDDDGHYLKIHVLKDAVIGKGSFNVPIIYTEVNKVLVYGGSEYALGNQNKIAYGQYLFDDDSISTFNLVFTYQSSRMGIYRGGMDSLEKFLDPEEMEEYQLHRGDWFTWVGLEETHQVYNNVECTFVPAKVYYWNGLYWEEDTNMEHNSVALSDVLSTAEDAIAKNNSDVNTMLNRLVSNQIFVKQLVASNAFVNALFARNIMIAGGGWIQSEGYDGKTTGFRLNANGTFECINGVFNGAIDSGPLKLNRTSAGIYTIVKNTGTNLYQLYEELTQNGIFSGDYVITGAFSGKSASRLSVSVDTNVSTTEMIYVTSRKENTLTLPSGGVNIPGVGYVPTFTTTKYWTSTYNKYHCTNTTYSVTFTTNNGTWSGTKVVKTYEEESDLTGGDLSEYNKPNYESGQTTYGGKTTGMTDITFGEDTMTFKLMNLPSAKLPTLTKGCIYQEDGILKIVT